MFGPMEKQRCQHHPRRWEMYRWIWPVDGTPADASTPVYIRSCEVCKSSAPADEPQPIDSDCRIEHDAGTSTGRNDIVHKSRPEKKASSGARTRQVR